MASVMTAPFRAGVDAIYASPLACDAIYRAQNAAEHTVRAVFTVAGTGRDWAPAGAPVDQPTVGLRVSEVAAPREGDDIVIGGTSYRLVNAVRSDARLEWHCEIQETAA